jgi:valyl-tRNA synthetase
MLSSPLSRLVGHWRHRTACRATFNVRALVEVRFLRLTADNTVFLRVQSHNEAALYEAQVPTMLTLTKGCKSVKVVRELNEIPEGCGSAVISPTVAVYVLVRVCLAVLHGLLCADVCVLQGQVDIDVEIAKCDKKLDLARMNLVKVQKVETQADYEQTVPADVRALNEDKVGLW